MRVKVSMGTREGFLPYNYNHYLFLSSPRCEVMKAAVEGLLEKGEVKLGRLPSHLESMEVLREPGMDGREVKFRTHGAVDLGKGAVELGGKAVNGLVDFGSRVLKKADPRNWF